MAAQTNRFGRFLKSSVSALLQPAEDPRKSDITPEHGQQKLLAQVRNASARLAVIRERLQKQRATVAESNEALDGEARHALRSGQEELARLALQRQRIGMTELTHLDRQIAGLRREEDRLAAIGQRVFTQIEAVRAREQMAAARHSAAKAQVAVGEALSGFGSIAGDTGVIEQIERDAEALEARADAIEELTSAGILGEANGFFARPEMAESGRRTDDEIERRLDQLKTELKST